MRSASKILTQRREGAEDAKGLNKQPLHTDRVFVVVRFQSYTAVVRLKPHLQSLRKKNQKIFAFSAPSRLCVKKTLHQKKRAHKAPVFRRFQQYNLFAGTPRAGEFRIGFHPALGQIHAFELFFFADAYAHYRLDDHPGDKAGCKDPDHNR